MKTQTQLSFLEVQVCSLNSMNEIQSLQFNEIQSRVKVIAFRQWYICFFTLLKVYLFPWGGKDKDRSQTVSLKSYTDLYSSGNYNSKANKESLFAIRLDIKNIFTYLVFHLSTPTYPFHHFLTDINHLIPSHINFCLKLVIHHLMFQNIFSKLCSCTFSLQNPCLTFVLPSFILPFPPSSESSFTLLQTNMAQLKTLFPIKLSHIISWFANAETLESTTRVEVMALTAENAIKCPDPPLIKECI